MNKTQKAISVVGVIAVILILMPKDRWEALAETRQRLTNPDAVACMDYERKSLKDPDSAQLISFERTGSDKGDIDITYKAKNGYGAYVTGTALCSVTGGEVDDLSTRLLRETREVRAHVDELERQNHCLLERNDLMRQGASLEDANRQVDRLAACEGVRWH